MKIIAAAALAFIISSTVNAETYFNFETQSWVNDSEDNRIEKCTQIATELVRRDIRSGVIPVGAGTNVASIANSFMSEYVAICMDRGWWRDVN